MQNKNTVGVGIQKIFDRILPSYARLPLVITVIWNCTVYYGSKLIARSWPHYLMESAFDDRIPFLPWTAAVYLGCYVFWVVNFILCTRESKETAYRFLSAELLAKAVCLVFFLLLPTTNVRPVVEDSGFWNSVMAMVYRADTPTNLFPSIHCLESWFCYIGLRKLQSVPKWYRSFSFFYAIAIFVSTLTTKQHVIADVAGGVLLAWAAYHSAEALGFTKLYTRVFDRLHVLLKKSIPVKQEPCSELHRER